MKTHLPILLLFFLCQTFTSTHAQRINFGLGFHSNHGKLILGNQIRVIDSFSLSSRISNRVGGNVFVEFTTKNSFTLRTNISIKQNQIKIMILEDIDARRRNGELLKYNFSSTELELQASYRLEFPGSKWSIYPSLGVSIGMSKLSTISSSQRANYTPFEFRNRDLRGTTNLDIGDQLIYATINGSLRIHPPLFVFKRQIEFHTNYGLSLLPYLEEPLDLSPFSVEGSYHFFSFGVNFYLRKSPTTPKK